MSTVGQRERLTQQQVLRLFRDELGYRYLGDWKDRAGNRNIEEDLLSDWLGRQGHEERAIDRALRELDLAAAIAGSTTLYDPSRAVYEKLRDGVQVKLSVPEQIVTVWLLDWENPGNNDRAVGGQIFRSAITETLYETNCKREGDA